MEELTLREKILRKTTISNLALKLGRDVSRVSRWLKAGRIPAEQVIAVEGITGIPRQELRPDIYPED